MPEGSSPKGDADWRISLEHRSLREESSISAFGEDDFRTPSASNPSVPNLHGALGRLFNSQMPISASIRKPRSAPRLGTWTKVRSCVFGINKRAAGDRGPFSWENERCNRFRKTTRCGRTPRRACRSARRCEHRSNPAAPAGGSPAASRCGSCRNSSALR